MRIAHGHREVGVPQAALQNQNVSAIHHEVRCEGVAQDMGELTFLQVNIGSFDALSESRVARSKEPVSCFHRVVVSVQLVRQLRRNR